MLGHFHCNCPALATTRLRTQANNSFTTLRKLLSFLPQKSCSQEFVASNVHSNSRITSSKISISRNGGDSRISHLKNHNFICWTKFMNSKPIHTVIFLSKQPANDNEYNKYVNYLLRFRWIYFYNNTLNNRVTKFRNINMYMSNRKLDLTFD